MRHIGYLVLPIKIRAILARHVKCNHHHHHNLADNNFFQNPSYTIDSFHLPAHFV